MLSGANFVEAAPCQLATANAHQLIPQRSQGRASPHQGLWQPTKTGTCRLTARRRPPKTRSVTPPSAVSKPFVIGTGGVAQRTAARWCLVWTSDCLLISQSAMSYRSNSSLKNGTSVDLACAWLRSSAPPKRNTSYPRRRMDRSSAALRAYAVGDGLPASSV